MAGTNRKAVELGFYPISITHVKQLLKDCKEWEYGNKDTCKYVAEQVIQKIELENPELPIIDTLNDDLKSIAHNMNKGAKYLRIKIKFKIN